ncbi:MAG: DUF2802 domain-containing protein [Cellvibrionaceae bacterium]
MTITDIHTSITTFLQSMGSDTLIVGIALIACVVSFFSLLRSHQKARNLFNKLQRLEHDLKIANNSAIGMGQQLISLEKQLKQQPVVNQAEAMALVKEAENIATKEALIEAPVNNSGSDNPSVYDRARQLLHHEQDINKVAKQCGLSYAEVSLLKALGKQTTTSHSH